MHDTSEVMAVDTGDSTSLLLAGGGAEKAAIRPFPLYPVTYREFLGTASTNKMAPLFEADLAVVQKRDDPTNIRGNNELQERADPFILLPLIVQMLAVCCDVLCCDIKCCH